MPLGVQCEPGQRTFLLLLSFSGSRWLLPQQRVRQPEPDPEPGQASAVRQPDGRSPGDAEGVELQTEPRHPEAEGEPAEPGSERPREREREQCWDSDPLRLSPAARQRDVLLIDVQTVGTPTLGTLKSIP